MIKESDYKRYAVGQMSKIIILFKYSFGKLTVCPLNIYLYLYWVINVRYAVAIPCLLRLYI